MLGDIMQLADDLWLVVGDMPADVANAIVYRRGERLYQLDSGAGPTFRASVLRVLDQAGPVRCFTLLNSHGHADHVGNNDLIGRVRAVERGSTTSRRPGSTCSTPPPTSPPSSSPSARTTPPRADTGPTAFAGA